MQSPVPELHPKLRATLDALAADGITPTDAELIWLGRLRWACDHQESGEPTVPGSPIEYCGVRFWQLHNLAESWGVKWYRRLEGYGVAQVLVYPFAHTRSRPGDASLRELIAEKEVVDTVMQWWESVPIPRDALVDMIERLRALDGQEETVADPDKAEPTDEPQGTCALSGVAMLCKAFEGTTPEFWLTDIGAHDARTIMAHTGESGGFATSHARTVAISNYLNAVKWIRKAHADGE